jgi:uncharacterized protein (TIRG00374 family)
MKKTLLTILKYIFFLGLGVGIIYLMLHQQKPKERQEMVNAIKSVNLWMFVPIFFIGFLSHYFRALRWKLLLEPLQIHPSTINITFAVLIGYLANLVVPRGGEVAKCTILAKYEKMPAHKMVGTIVAERAFDIICLVIITVLTFLLQASIIGSFAKEKWDLLVAKLIASKIVLGIIVLVIAILVITTIILYRRHRETQVGHFLRGISHGFISIIHMKKRWQFIGYTFLVWLMYTLQIYLAFLSMPATHDLSLLAALAVLIFGSVGMIVTPGGLGAYTILVAQILHSYAVNDNAASAFGFVAWAGQTGIIIVLGIASLLFIHPYNKKKNAQTAMDRA